MIDEDVSRVATRQQTLEEHREQQHGEGGGEAAVSLCVRVAARRPRVTVCQLIFAQCGDGGLDCEHTASHCNTSSLSDPFVL